MEDTSVTMKDIFDVVKFLAIVLGIIVFINVFIGQQVEVDGNSMENTLHTKEHLIVEKVSYRFSDPKRYDIIVFKPFKDEKSHYIKRIIGLPGDTIQIIGNNIFINGKIIDESYGLEKNIEDRGIANKPVVVGKDEYFVLGDNRNNSADSRVEGIGNVKRKSILGKAWFRTWPIKRMGILDHK